MKTEINEVRDDSNVVAAGNHSSGAPLTDRATEAAHDTIDRISNNAAKAEKHVRGAVANGEVQLRDKGAEARVNSEKAIEQIRDYAKENPLMAAGIAFASGLLVSRIVGR
jgi:ElaB/YqjD/DUF883 family membrane-anchored ribosome-binding protein